MKWKLRGTIEWFGREDHERVRNWLLGGGGGECWVVGPASGSHKKTSVLVSGCKLEGDCHAMNSNRTV